MGVLTHLYPESTIEMQESYLENAKEAFSKADIERCIENMTQGIRSYKEKIAHKPHKVVFRQKIIQYWEFWKSTVCHEMKMNRTFMNDQEDYKNRPIHALKAFVLDTFLEGEWKTQCQGKYGGEKPLGCSWKEWYDIAEQQVESLPNTQETMKWAIEHGHLNYVQFLIGQELDIKIADIRYDFDTPAISRVIDKNIKEMALYLIDIGVQIKGVDVFGWNALHYAVYRSNSDVVTQLLKQGIPLNSKDKEGRTSLHIAVMSSANDISKKLLLEGIKVNYKDKQGNTALYYALLLGNQALINLLVEHGADVNVKDKFGRSFAHSMVILNKPFMLESLIENKAALNSKDIFGRTPMHYAACYGHSSCLDLLLKASANSRIQDLFNETPLLVAAAADNKVEMAMLHKLTA